MIVVHRTIIHSLNKGEKSLIVADYENSNDDLNKSLAKVYKSVSKDKFLRKAVFNNYESNPIRVAIDDILYDNTKFISASKVIAESLFDEVLINNEMDSCSLAVVLLTVKDERKVGVFKLDYKKNYSSSVKELKDNSFRIDIIENNNSLSSSIKSSQAIIAGPTSANEEFHIEVLDKKAEKNDEESGFIKNFLNVTKVIDDAYKTRILKQTVENFITNNFVDEIRDGEEAKSLFVHMLTDEETLSPESFIEKAIHDEMKREILTEILEEKGIDVSTEIDLDKDWIEKETKTITKKLDTGFVLKGSLEDFKDAMKYSIRENKDGSVDIVLKNIRLSE